MLLQSEVGVSDNNFGFKFRGVVPDGNGINTTFCYEEEGTKVECEDIESAIHRVMFLLEKRLDEIVQHR